MGQNTIIAWTEHTWNPWRGCTKISPGCAHCYMFTQQERYGRDPHVVTRTKTWGDPLRWERAAAKAGKTERVAAPRTESGIMLDGEIVRAYPTPRLIAI